MCTKINMTIKIRSGLINQQDKDFKLFSMLVPSADLCKQFGPISGWINMVQPNLDPNCSTMGRSSGGTGGLDPPCKIISYYMFS